ncbi:hypothetical protein HYALB_00006417 [Hymenoscyphus albidus]|uniref:Isochorismatase-like domain-containing protein n=1 Tax=Hymenoscyphus albidus TaxID=595503 RepID=A0A9N9LKN8_9HELO|nr:hypothetical protein HYALB_00006417 [Hymenoscyphus albidus]
MKTQILSALAYASTALAQGFIFERLNKSDAALLIVDHQIGLLSIVGDVEPTKFRNAIFAHAALGPLFGLPVVITSSADTGANGMVPAEILQSNPNATIVKRAGEVNSWDSPEFRAAVEATGKRQMIIAGVTTDICTTFLALSLREAGYSVWANTEASGTFDKSLSDNANRRMESAGVHLMGLFALISDLMRDWRSTPGAVEVLPFVDRYIPAYSWVARAHTDAIANN